MPFLDSVRPTFLKLGEIGSHRRGTSVDRLSHKPRKSQDSDEKLIDMAVSGSKSTASSSVYPSCPQLSKLSGDTDHVFAIPGKKIHEGPDVTHFLTSQAYGNIMSFLLQLNVSSFPQKRQISGRTEVQSWPADLNATPAPTATRNFTTLLHTIEAFIDDIPLDNGPRRFGNISFRTWYDRVIEQAPALLQRHLPPFTVKTKSSGSEIHEELLPYLLGSFGSAQRLDYGSGHELSFFAFLACIWKLGGFDFEADYTERESSSGALMLGQSRSIVFKLLDQYFHLVRRLIKTYNLEPAGSHGVWGLDDHSFLPYIFGSAQYGPAIDPSTTSSAPTEGSLPDAPDPASVTNLALVSRYRETNLYFGAVGFIHDVKRGPFWEHSPMLYDISGVKAGWAKINKVCF